ncbi:hypothetical protein BJV77DRAFT_992156 [Russula vinacea]|nr:hypothetical protein BJV77DRAFT_992156 [Russula vinacea]
MTLRRSFSAASTFSSLVILLEARRLPPFSVDRAGPRSLLVPVLQIPLSPLWILSRPPWIGWTLRAMAVLAPSRTYISSDAWTPFVIPLLSLSRSLSVAFSPGVIASVPLRLESYFAMESYFAVSGNPQRQRFHLVDPLRDLVLYSSPTTGWKCCCEALTDQRLLQGPRAETLLSIALGSGYGFHLPAERRSPRNAPPLALGSGSDGVTNIRLGAALRPRSRHRPWNWQLLDAELCWGPGLLQAGAAHAQCDLQLARMRRGSTN